MQGQRDYMTGYLVYFSIHTLATGVFVALYSLTAFSEPAECLSFSKVFDVSTFMTVTLKVYFFIHMTELVNSAFLGPFFKVLVPM